MERGGEGRRDCSAVSGGGMVDGSGRMWKTAALGTGSVEGVEDSEVIA